MRKMRLFRKNKQLLKRYPIVLLIFLFLAYPCRAEKVESAPGFKPAIVPEEKANLPDYSFDFKVTPKLKSQVDFWKNVYSKYSSDQVIIHDKEHLGVVYTVLDFSALRNGRRSERLIRRKRRQLVEKTKEKYRRILKKLSKKRLNVKQLKAEEKRIYDLFKPIKEKNKFSRARNWRRIRAQVGQKDRFSKGLVRSGRYIKVMEDIFRNAGLPVELTRLPFVESFFNTQARSKCGATGMWQFMYSTGRLYLKINHVVDERKDPFISTRAAAELLTHNYKRLGSWPLALTAYNHGALGVARGLKRTQAETLEELIESYNHRRFGFASKNFYAEFLAALETSRNHRKYFGSLRLDQPLQFDTVELPYYTSSKDLEKYCNISRKTLKTFNPALRLAILKGYNYIPKGYPLRVPRGTKEIFLASYEKIPKEKKFLAQKRSIRHKVRRGETLSTIARRYRTSMKKILAANSLKNRHFLRTGQLLRIPAYGVSPLAAPARAVVSADGNIRHRVRRGESLSRIAKHYNVRVDDILAANTLSNRNFLTVGQLLRIPVSGASTVAAVSNVSRENIRHRVRRGESLSKIARRYNTSLRSIVLANNLPNRHFLRVGQKLIIPQTRQVAYAPKTIAKTVVAQEPPETERSFASTPQEEIVEAIGAANKIEDGSSAEFIVEAENGNDSVIQKITVYPHETLGHYAEWARLPTHSLRRLNNLRYRQSIHVGQKLMVDLSQVSRVEFDKKRQAFHEKLEKKYLSQYKIEKVLTHRLKKRQNVWYLCRYVYKVPIWLVKKYNANKNLAELNVGDELLIPILKEM